MSSFQDFIDYLMLTDRTLDVVYSRFRGISFTITLREKPKEVSRMLSVCHLTLHARNSFGLSLRVIENEIKKRRHLVLLLFNLCFIHSTSLYSIELCFCVCFGQFLVRLLHFSQGSNWFKFSHFQVGPRFRIQQRWIIEKCRA